MSLNIVQGEWVSSNESLYVVFPFAPSSHFSTCFLSDGSVYHVIPGSTYDGYDGYGGFLNSTKNWRGISVASGDGGKQLYRYQAAFDGQFIRAWN